MPAETNIARPKRADARRNIASILDAAARELSRDPDASVADIARAAGVGRVTLYGHFPSRAELIEATLLQAIATNDALLEAVDVSGDAREALSRLIATSWESIVRVGSLFAAAEQVLPAERIRGVHARPAARVERLIERGRVQGVFRTDLPAAWLVGTLHRVTHGAAADIEAGRLDPSDAVFAITATILGAFTPIGEAVPSPTEVGPRSVE